MNTDNIFLLIAGVIVIAILGTVGLIVAVLWVKGRKKGGVDIRVDTTTRTDVPPSPRRSQFNWRKPLEMFLWFIGGYAIVTTAFIIIGAPENPWLWFSQQWLHIIGLLVFSCLIVLTLTSENGKKLLVGLILLAGLVFVGSWAFKAFRTATLDYVYAIPGVINTPKDGSSEPKLQDHGAPPIQKYSVSADQLTKIAWPKNPDGSEDLYWNYRTWKTPRPVLDYIRQKLEPPPEQPPQGQIPNDTEDSGLSDSRENLWVNVNPDDKTDLTEVIIVYSHR